MFKLFLLDSLVILSQVRATPRMAAQRLARTEPPDALALRYGCCQSHHYYLQAVP